MKTDFKFLYGRMIRSAQKYLGRIFISVFLVSLLEFFNSTVFTAGAGWFFTRISESPYYHTCGLILFACGIFVLFLIQSGFSVMLLRMARDQFVTIGYVFYSFRKFKKMGSAALFITSIFVLISAAVRFCVKTFLKDDSAAMNFLVSRLGESGPLFVVSGITLFLMFLAFYILIFLFPAKYDNPDKSVFQCAAISCRIVFRYFFKFPGFVLRVCGSNLILALFYGGMSLYMAESSESPFVYLFSIVFSFLYLKNLLKAYSLASLSVPVFYQWALEPKIDIIVSILEEYGKKVKEFKKDETREENKSEDEEK